MKHTKPRMWAGAAIAFAYTDGLGFLSTTVEVPLWALLLMAFLPLGEIVDAIRYHTPGFETRDAVETDGR